MPVKALVTLGILCKRLNVASHRVLYAIRRLGIHPMAKAGQAHIYDDHTIDQIRAELARIESRKTKK